MIINYETMFGRKPKENNTPMEENNHPEIDNTKLLDATGIKQYQAFTRCSSMVSYFGLL
jgi:hypothetical protein